MPDDEWTAWLARPIAEREAILDKVCAAFKVGGAQAGHDIMKANGMPISPAGLVIPADVPGALRELEDEQDGDTLGDGLWEPPGRTDH